MHSQFEPTCVCIRVRKLWSCSIFQPTSTLDCVIGKEQKSVNLKYITVGRLDDDMIVPPSDGAMFILID